MKVRVKKLWYFVILLLFVPVGAMADMRYDFFFQEATGKRLADKMDEAVALYEHCLRIDSQKAEAMFELGRLRVAVREAAEGVVMMRNAADRDTLNANYQENVASLMLQMNMDDDVITYLERLARLQPTRTEVLAQLVRYYRTHGDTDKALSVIDRIEMQDGRTLQTTAEKFEIRMLQRDSLQAFREYDTLCEELPYDVMTRLQYGKICRMYGDTLRSQQLYDEARQIDATETEIVLLRDEALSLLQKQAPEEKVAEVLVRLLELEPDDEMVMGYLMEYYGKREEYDKLEDLCRRGVNLFPTNIGYSYFLGVTLMQQKKMKEAADVFRKGLERKEDSARPSLISDMWGLLGDVYHELGARDMAFAALDSALTYNRDNVVVMNNYAYYLSLRGERLEEAEEMSRRTLRASSDNPIYVDTYAWILFMQGKYGDAKVQIDKVVVPDSTDAALMDDKYCMSNVLEHAGDIAWKVGKEQEALRFWRLAQERNDGTATEALPGKIKRRKYDEE